MCCFVFPNEQQAVGVVEKETEFSVQERNSISVSLVLRHCHVLRGLFCGHLAKPHANHMEMAGELSVLAAREHLGHCAALHCLKQNRLKIL